MPQGRVVHAPPSIHLRPCHGKVVIRAMDFRIGKIELAGVKTHQEMYFIARKGLHLVDFIAEDESMRPLLHTRKLRVFYYDGCVEGPPWMLIERPSNHIYKLRPLGQRNRRAMHPDQSFAVVVHER